MLPYRDSSKTGNSVDSVPHAFQPNYELSTKYSQTDTQIGAHNSNVIFSEERILTDYFVCTVVPPILAQIETQLNWSSIRQLLISMSAASTMVHYAILSFSSLLMSKERGMSISNLRQYYDRAKEEVTQKLQEHTTESPTALEHLLATLFFLSYIDLLEGRIEQAHINLKEAYAAFHRAEKASVRMVSKRLVSWLRLLDARAVSAGGEGLFLSEDSNDFIAESSPGSVDIDGGGDIREASMEDVLFDVLYQPSFHFFQRIQSFMGRISKIDPWHRSRGTVSDETEVMGIAAKISQDLTKLWDQRPQLMDYSLNGRLTSAHITENLVFTITRSCRTCLANYHASRIHLHRVAYKHLPLSPETLHAIATIRNTATMMVEREESESKMLPVNMLWPLLMWGCEETDMDKREWIHARICEMETVATNAAITARVLREVQSRQDESHSRVDVRTVMHDIYSSCFAIV
jgi:hypothetical protein